MAKDAEQGCAGIRLLDHRADVVHQTLRSRPFQIEAGFKELLVGNDVIGGDRGIQLGEKMTGRRRVELDVGVEIKVPVVRIDAVGVLVKHVAAPVDSILGIQRSRHAADKSFGSSKSKGP